MNNEEKVLEILKKMDIEVYKQWVDTGDGEIFFECDHLILILRDEKSEVSIMPHVNFSPNLAITLIIALNTNDLEISLSNNMYYFDSNVDEIVYVANKDYSKIYDDDYEEEYEDDEEDDTDLGIDGFKINNRSDVSN
jgi:hypothetical protein